MCGIVGIYGRQEQSEIEVMLNKIKHRGPDGFGVWRDRENMVSFGHARLSIIDTSSNGNQPMSYDGRYYIVYNGEIYNYLELRQELEASGIIFKTNTDTEVVLACFSFWGSEFVNKLIGMFSFAIFDQQSQVNQPNLFIYRDRFGIKPLLFKQENDKFYFGSELSLFLSDKFSNYINPEALVEYLAFGCALQPNTFLEGVKSLPAGHFMEVSMQGINIKKYWNLHENTKNLRKSLLQITYEEAITNVQQLLRKSITRSLVADVEIGVFLSGGIDSSAILGLMREKTDEVKSYTVGFDENNLHIDETVQATSVANFFDCPIKKTIVENKDVGQLFDEIVQSIDQPSLDGTNTFIVSKLASKDVKVSLSGIGGDEIFAGYPHFHSYYWKNSNRSKPGLGLNTFVNFLYNWKQNRFTIYLIERYSELEIYMSNQRRVLTNNQIKKVLKISESERVDDIISKYIEGLSISDADIIQKITYFEIYNYLQNILLRDSDVMSMSNGLEIRPVFLDHELVEYVYSLPAKFKMNKLLNKKLLQDSLAEILPKKLLSRKKMGFELPYLSWIAGPLNSRFISLFNSEMSSSIFDQNFIEMNLELLRKRIPNNATWSCGVLIAWLQFNKLSFK